MAGHSKWANIQHRKKKQDAKRGHLFTKLIKGITVAARMGGGDANANPRLRDAISKAKLANMTNDTIDRAVKKGAGGLDGANVEEIVYEGYGPGGVAVIVECLTDNRNRTGAEVRHAFSKCGGNLGTDGSVSYLFSKQGQMSFSAGTNEDTVMHIALEAGADDVIINDDKSIDLICMPENFDVIKDALLKQKLEPNYAAISMSASLSVNLDDKEIAEKMLKLQEMLDDLDDVQEVYTNAEIDSEILEQIG